MPSRGEAKRRQNKRRNGIRDALRALDRAKAILRHVHQQAGLTTGNAVTPAASSSSHAPLAAPGVPVSASSPLLKSTVSISLLQPGAQGSDQGPSGSQPQQPAASCSYYTQQVLLGTAGHREPAGPSSNTTLPLVNPASASRILQEPAASSQVATAGQPEHAGAGSYSSVFHETDEVLLDASVWDGLEQDEQLTRLLANCDEAADELERCRRNG